MIKEIFVDMDGVLSDFRSKFKEIYSFEPLVHYPDETVFISRYKTCFRDFVADGYFARLDPMPDFVQGMIFLNSLSEKYKIKILSSTAREEYLDALSYQKSHWLKNYDIDFPAVFVPGKHLKMNYSGPDKILIDDTKANIDDWNEKGGHGILHKSWSKTIEEVKTLLG